MITLKKLKILTVVCFCLLFSLISVSTYAQSDGNSMEVFITLEDAKELIPDILAMPVTVNVTTIKEIDAVNILGSVDKSLRGLGFDYRGGKYSIYKNCSWEKGKEICSGYKGSISYVFELTEPAGQNKVFETLSNFKEKYGEKIDIAISNPQWIVSKKSYQKEEDSLKIEIIDSAKDFARKISEKLGKTCSLASMNYDVRKPQLWWSSFEEGLYLKTARSMAEAPEPKKEEKTVSVKVSVKMLCK